MPHGRFGSSWRNPCFSQPRTPFTLNVFPFNTMPIYDKPVRVLTMRTRWRSIAVAFIASLIAQAVGASDPAPAGTVQAYGILNVVTDEKVERAPGTTSGERRTAERAFVGEQTEKIPARLGVRFGFEYRLTGLPKDEVVVLRKVLVHPLIKTPDGKEKRGYAVNLKRQTTEEGTRWGFTGYGFDHEFELVPGDWKIELWFKDVKLTEQVFKVYAPQN